MSVAAFVHLGNNSVEVSMKKTFARIAISFVSAFFLSLSTGWWFVIHHLRFEMLDKSEETINAAAAARANLNLFMNSTIAAGCVACVGLTWLFYRLIR